LITNRMTPGQTKAIRERNREGMRQALTVKDVAHALNCAEQTVRVIIKQGGIRAFRIGGEFRVLPTDLDAYIESQMESA
jgi:excisionase family DNA binding protein